MPTPPVTAGTGNLGTKGRQPKVWGKDGSGDAREETPPSPSPVAPRATYTLRGSEGRGAREPGVPRGEEEEERGIKGDPETGGRRGEGGERGGGEEGALEELRGRPRPRPGGPGGGRDRFV